jgi:hypothetical protein
MTVLVLSLMISDDTAGRQHQIASITRFPPALLLGGHSVSDPPDPISNSAVKPDCADGTNAQALEE